jgi:lipoate-protein ligase A
VDDDITFLDERAADVEDLVDEFLQRVLAAFEKELGVSEPEIEVWTDWEGEYAAQTPMGGLPGLPGIAG